MVETPRIKVKQVNVDDALAAAYIQCFDHKYGEEVLKHLEKTIKGNMPDYNNSNRHYALTGQLMLVESIKTTVKQSKNQIGKGKIGC